MEERKRPERDDEAQTEKERAEEREEDAGDKEDEEDRDEEAEEEEEEERAAPADAALHAAGVLELMHRVLHDKELDITDDMPRHERRGLEMLYLARVGDTGTGNRASAGLRMQYLVEAMAQLQPALALARSPLLEPMHTTIEDIKTEIADLRREIRFKSAEITVARKKKDKELGSDEAERSREGELAADIAVLARKKRARFAHDPRKHPIAAALEQLTAELVAMGKIAAELATVDAERRAAPAEQRAELDRRWQERAAALGARTTALLASCAPVPEAEAARDPRRPGAHPPLVEAFAPLAARATGGMEPAQAIGLAAEVAAVIDELLDGQDALVGAGDPAAARKGIFARLFGRKE